MSNSIIISADDFGLTRGITDTMLEVVDNGPVRLVSILANGEDVEYALAEYKKRAGKLTLALHLNFTEGKALCAPHELPHLVDKQGNFKHSVFGLAWAYILNPADIRKEIHREISAQFERIGATHINGHQHVHMLPFVFDEAITLPGISSVRIVREPFFFCGSMSPVNFVARIVLAVTSRRNARVARIHGVKTNDWFIGLAYSGRMIETIVHAGLAHIKSGSVEILFHPGSAQESELCEWKAGRADIAWHYSPWRERERASLQEMTIPKK